MLFSSEAGSGRAPEEQTDEEQALVSPAATGRVSADESVEVIRTPSETIQILPSNGDASVLDNEADNESAPLALARRLRCLFSTVTWPIVPLGSIVALALAWMLYAAFVLDLRRSCSHPLHWYAAASLALVSYTPNHAHVRSLLFQYSRESEPIRPRSVRMYDQLFHTICLLYVYGGVTLLQACRDDEVKNNESPVSPGYEPSTCAATCPNLHQALSVYVATLEMFTVALILPLLFLPCIYLWILRRATEEMDAFAQLHDRLEEEEALLNGEGVTAQELMDSLDRVKLVSRKHSDGVTRTVVDVLKGQQACDGNDDSPRRGLANVKECCICMTEFDFEDENDEENGSSDTLPLIPQNNETEATHASQHHTVPTDKLIVRTRCGHMFHYKCLAGWIGGRWQQSQQENRREPARTRARRTCCPLCREDLKPRSQYQSA